MGALKSLHALQATDTKRENSLTSPTANRAARKSRHFLFLAQRGVRRKTARSCECEIAWL